MENRVPGDDATGKRLMRLAWVMWGTAMLVQLLNLFHRMAGATIADRLMADFDISATVVGNVTALFFYVYAVMQFPSGGLADSLGPRKTISIGALISGIGALIFGLAPNLPILFLGRFLASLGVSVVMISVLKIAAMWFPSRNFGFMTAFTGVTSQLGGIFATTPLALLMVLVGWRGSFEMVGLVTLVISLACWLVIRNRPQDKGLPSPAELEGRKTNTRIEPRAVAQLTLGARLKLLFGNRHIWPTLLVGIGLYGTVQAFTGAWGIAYLMQVYDMTRSAAANYMLLVAVAMMCGSLLVAYLSNRVLRRRKPLAIICTSGYLGIWLLLTFWNPGKLPPLSLSAIFIAIGFFYGYQSQNLACAKELSPPSIAGLTLGFVNVGPFLTPAILQPLFGMVLDHGWQGAISQGARVYPVAAFHTALLLICGVAALCWIGALTMKETRCRDLFV